MDKQIPPYDGEDYDIAMSYGRPGSTRRATPDDPPCSCGAPARFVFRTDRFGDVPWCGHNAI